MQERKDWCRQRLTGQLNIEPVHRASHNQDPSWQSVFDAVMETLPQGVVLATLDGRVRSNRSAGETVGPALPATLHTLEQALEGTASTATVRFTDGSKETWISSVATPILVDGEIFGALAVNTDVTKSRMQDQMLRKSERLAAVGQLASSIAHEINNPLESITNLLYLIRHSCTMDEVQQYAILAEQELARVSEITTQTLGFHRQQSKPAPVDFSDLLSNVVSLYTGRFLMRGIAVETKIAPSLLVQCFEGEMRQVVNNLIRNAIDAMGTGGRLSVRVRAGCDLHRRDGVFITIADTGEGISPHILEHLFEPFYTTKELTGTGLGLWVSKGIIDKHGGRIAVRTCSAERHGKVFSLWLPLSGEHLLSASEEQVCGAVDRERANRGSSAALDHDETVIHSREG